MASVDAGSLDDFFTLSKSLKDLATLMLPCLNNLALARAD